MAEVDLIIEVIITVVPPLDHIVDISTIHHLCIKEGFLFCSPSLHPFRIGTHITFQLVQDLLIGFKNVFEKRKILWSIIQAQKWYKIEKNFTVSHDNRIY